MNTIQSERIVAAARELLKAHGYFVDNLWHTSDIDCICEQEGYAKLSQKEAMIVFDIANERFDGEYGIDWPQLQQALGIYMERFQSTASQSLQESMFAENQA